jgi:hypothetical protein
MTEQPRVMIDIEFANEHEVAEFMSAFSKMVVDMPSSTLRTHLLNGLHALVDQYEQKRQAYLELPFNLSIKA